MGLELEICWGEEGIGEEIIFFETTQGEDIL